MITEQAFGEVEKVHTRVLFMWRFDHEGFPIQQDVHYCPLCIYVAKEGLHITRYHFHVRPKSSIRHRCDVTVKCPRCSAVFTYGVAMRSEVYDLHGPTAVFNRHREEFA